MSDWLGVLALGALVLHTLLMGTNGPLAVQAILRTMTRSGTFPQSLAQRARIILLAFDGLRNEDIATSG